jgi:CRP-like cAMP-binding protein
MGMLSGRRRSATIRALGDFTAMKLRAATVERMSINAQLRFQRCFLTALIERLEVTTERLAAASEPH